MTDYRSGESLEKYLENRRFWLEVVLGAVILGCPVNLFASAVWEDLHDIWPEGLFGSSWIAIGGGALLVIVVAILSYLLRRDLSETSGLTLVLPLAVAKDKSSSEMLNHPTISRPNMAANDGSQPIKACRNNLPQIGPGRIPLLKRTSVPAISDGKQSATCWMPLSSNSCMNSGITP